ncbi:MAG: VCBS repeat-containing protein, partial [Planctomycetota bacterium]
RGLILPAAVPYSITLADYDQDGDLDIFACCYDRRFGVNRERIFAKAIPYHDANNGGRNVMLRNDSSSSDLSGGNWKFRYVTDEVGLNQNNRRFSYAASWEDYDNDGDLDLYVANDFGRNNLYRNDQGKFTDVAKEAGVEDISAGMSISWNDYNNDGWMDVYVSNMFSSAGNRIAFQRKFHEGVESETKELFQRHARGNSLFENSKDGTFKDVSVDVGVTMGRWAWGSRFLDINNDGWQDILVANGFLTQGKADDL